MNRWPQPPSARVVLALVLALAAIADGAAQAPAPDADEGLRAVAQLAEINGQALACDDPSTVRRAKALMLAHAPKTARFADAFEQGTQRAYLAVTRNEVPCPDAAALAARTEAVSRRLQAALPASAPAR